MTTSRTQAYQHLMFSFQSQKNKYFRMILSDKLYKKVKQNVIAGKNKTVQHDVNRISVETKLYNVPK